MAATGSDKLHFQRLDKAIDHPLNDDGDLDGPSDHWSQSSGDHERDPDTEHIMEPSKVLRTQNEGHSGFTILPSNDFMLVMKIAAQAGRNHRALMADLKPELAGNEVKIENASKNSAKAKEKLLILASARAHVKSANEERHAAAVLKWTKKCREELERIQKIKGTSMFLLKKLRKSEKKWIHAMRRLSDGCDDIVVDSGMLQPDDKSARNNFDYEIDVPSKPALYKQSDARRRYSGEDSSNDSHDGAAEASRAKFDIDPAALELYNQNESLEEKLQYAVKVLERHREKDRFYALEEYKDGLLKDDMEITPHLQAEFDARWWKSGQIKTREVQLAQDILEKFQGDTWEAGKECDGAGGHFNTAAHEAAIVEEDSDDSCSKSAVLKWIPHPDIIYHDVSSQDAGFKDRDDFEMHANRALDGLGKAQYIAASVPDQVAPPANLRGKRKATEANEANVSKKRGRTAKAPDVPDQDRVSPIPAKPVKVTAKKHFVRGKKNFTAIEKRAQSQKSDGKEKTVNKVVDATKLRRSSRIKKLNGNNNPAPQPIAPVTHAIAPAAKAVPSIANANPPVPEPEANSFPFIDASPTCIITGKNNVKLIRKHDSAPPANHPIQVHKNACLAGTSDLGDIASVPVTGPRPMTYQLRVEDIIRENVSVFGGIAYGDPVRRWRIDAWARRVREGWL